MNNVAFDKIKRVLAIHFLLLQYHATVVCESMINHKINLFANERTEYISKSAIFLEAKTNCSIVFICD